jgi:hypothetical protein
LRCTNARQQERRASARRGANSPLQRLPLLWTNYVSPRTFASHTTAGSRQPLLLQGASRLKNNDIRGAQTQVHKSGGRQPAVVRITHGVRGGSHNVRRLSSPQPRAAGVSPPWSGHTIAVPREANIVQRGANTRPRAARRPSAVVRIRACNGDCFCGLITFRPAHSLPIPRLAHASRSCCATRVRCEMRDLLCTNARQQERRGVSPPWFEFALATATAFVD